MGSNCGSGCSDNIWLIIKLMLSLIPTPIPSSLALSRSCLSCSQDLSLCLLKTVQLLLVVFNVPHSSAVPPSIPSSHLMRCLVLIVIHVAHFQAFFRPSLPLLSFVEHPQVQDTVSLLPWSHHAQTWKTSTTPQWYVRAKVWRIFCF